MLSSFFQGLYRNIPNAVSLLGVTPLCVLASPEGARWLPALIIWNNLMDDLDGMLAKGLGLRSAFGAQLDNVCDAAAHAGLALFIGAFYDGWTLFAGQAAAAAVLWRMTSRVLPDASLNRGSTTNELMRHLLFLILIDGMVETDMAPWVTLTMLVHTVSLLCPFPMPYLLRTLAKSPTAILGINLMLLSAWLLPSTTQPIALAFWASYIYTFVLGAWRHMRRASHEKHP